MTQFKKIFTIIFFVCFTMKLASNNEVHTKFPSGFMIGAATSSYQIEGAVNEGGRGMSIWDTFVNKIPSTILDNSTAAVTTDSYHKFKEDVNLLKHAGFDHYRFSISWVRILPRGEIDNINQEGIDYYNRLIDELIKNNIVPVVTMYHWDLPQALQDLGGWFNPVIADYFEDYAFILYKNFGNRVKFWITLNEPTIINMGYYSNYMAPGTSIRGSGEYLVGYNLLRAHAKAYRLYERQFKQLQKGKVGITLVGEYYMPMSKSEDDKQATERAYAFNLGWFAHPIYTKEGDYPPLMKKIVDRNSALENRTRSRLPAFTQEEIKDLRGSSDFFGLNHYTSKMVSAKTSFTGTESYYEKDMMTILQPDPSWNATKENPIFYIVPTGMRGILNYIKNNYGNPPVFITENGYGDGGQLADYGRISFFDGYISNMLKAIYVDKCNVIGYTIWSLIDNFEWWAGYTIKYGIAFVDFNCLKRVRRPKLSILYFKEMLKTKRLPDLSNNIYYQEKLGFGKYYADIMTKYLNGIC